ncbi:WhiB family transcriptional regulator [Prauserella oleivorans]|uniref:WhiB family transcriptional regulator n=1 Tax=Prauserella oleivorans TaxID=1478153 RepID=A0ABW5W6M0_9PSEU
MNQPDYEEIAARLDRYAAMPDDVLAELVTRDGLAFWAFDRDAIPEPTGETEPDRELAAWLCAGCPVLDACLELELRWAGADTAGVWGGLAEDDRRAVHRVWAARRAAVRVWKVRHINRRPRGGDRR